MKPKCKFTFFILKDTETGEVIKNKRNVVLTFRNWYEAHKRSRGNYKPKGVKKSDEHYY